MAELEAESHWRMCRVIRVWIRIVTGLPDLVSTLVGLSCVK